MNGVAAAVAAVLVVVVEGGSLAAEDPLDKNKGRRFPQQTPELREIESE